MNITKEQYVELVEKLAEELIGDQMEKTAKTRNDFKEYDGVGDAGKRIGKYIGAGAALGGVAGAVAGKSPAAAGLGAYYGAGIGALGGTLHQTIRDDKSAKKRYADDPKALRDARLLGPQFADSRKQKRSTKEAAEALFEAVLYKQAAFQEKEEAELIAEASEKALNALGYSMFAK